MALDGTARGVAAREALQRGRQRADRVAAAAGGPRYTRCGDRAATAGRRRRQHCRGDRPAARPATAPTIAPPPAPRRRSICHTSAPSSCRMATRRANSQHRGWQWPEAGDPRRHPSMRPQGSTPLSPRPHCSPHRGMVRLFMDGHCAHSPPAPHPALTAPDQADGRLLHNGPTIALPSPSPLAVSPLYPSFFRRLSSPFSLTDPLPFPLGGDRKLSSHRGICLLGFRAGY